MLGPTASLLLLSAALAGCSGSLQRQEALEPVGPVLQIGAGTAHDTMQGGDNQWTGEIYRTADDMLCMNIRWQNGQGDGGCAKSFGPTITRDQLTTYLIGGTAVQGAASVRVVFEAEPPQVLALVIPPPGVTDGVGYYVASFDGGPVITSIETLNADMQVMETQRIDN